jgi:hypothetical protein
MAQILFQRGHLDVHDCNYPCFVLIDEDLHIAPFSCLLRLRGSKRFVRQPMQIPMKCTVFCYSHKANCAPLVGPTKALPSSTYRWKVEYFAKSRSYEEGLQDGRGPLLSGVQVLIYERTSSRLHIRFARARLALNLYKSDPRMDSATR